MSGCAPSETRGPLPAACNRGSAGCSGRSRRRAGCERPARSCRREVRGARRRSLLRACLDYNRSRGVLGRAGRRVRVGGIRPRRFSFPEQKSLHHPAAHEVVADDLRDILRLDAAVHHAVGIDDDVRAVRAQPEADASRVLDGGGQRLADELPAELLTDAFGLTLPSTARPGADEDVLAEGEVHAPLLNFQDRLDLQAGVEGKFRYSQAETSVLAALPVHLHEHFRGTLDDFEGIEKTGGSGDVADKLHHPLDAIEVFNRLLGGRQHAQGGEARRLLALLDGHFAPDLPWILQAAVLLGKLSRNEQQVPGPDALKVRPERLAHLRETVTKRFQIFFSVSCHPRPLPAVGRVVACRAASPRRTVLWLILASRRVLSRDFA